MNSFFKGLAVTSLALALAACGDNDSAVNSDSGASESQSGANGPDSPATGNNGASGGNAGTPAAGTPAASNSAVDLALATPELSILVEAVVAADLANTLSGEGPFTIFAPTNDAFVALLGELGVSKDQLFADKDLLTQVLTYHVVQGTVKAADVPLGQAISPLAGSLFKVEDSNGSLTITDGRNRMANIIATDVMADNAVIHLIDNVILPADKTIVETAQQLPDFSVLVEAVVAADLVGTLSGDGPFTVFAPTNDAFVALLGELGVTKDQLLADKDLLTQVLTYHVVPGQVLKVDVPVGTPIATVQGDSLTVDSNLAISDQRGRMANIVATDVFTSNGVIHVIDQVILPAQMEMPAPAAPATNTIVDIALANPEFSILVEAVVAADLVDALSGSAPLTVFAPTNAAFANLLGELGVTKEQLFADTATLKAVLLYHVLDFKVLANDIPFNSHIRAISGAEFSISEKLVITDGNARQSGITAVDIEADNGVIHVIDTVLLPN